MEKNNDYMWDYKIVMVERKWRGKEKYMREKTRRK
jgi:hypothetical protein